MERVVILGPVGAGKTALAGEIARRTGLPVVHLDPLFWRPGWRSAPKAEARSALAAAAEGDRWILDGNFVPEGDELDTRFERAETVILLDLPRRTCLWRVMKRQVLERRRPRADLPPGCSEGVSLDVLRWIWSYPRIERPRVLALLGRLEGPITVHKLRSEADTKRLLAAL